MLYAFAVYQLGLVMFQAASNDIIQMIDQFNFKFK